MRNSGLFGIALCLFIGFIALSMNADAADKKVAKSKTKAASSKVTQKPLEPFDINVDKLPPNFAGHNIKRIFTALSKSEQAFKKSEFESTDKYNAKLLEFKNSILLDGFKYDDTFVFVLKENIDINYNADDEVMEIRYKTPLNQYMPQIDAFTIAESKMTEYTAQNAYGAKVTVKKASVASCILFMQNWDKFKKAPGLGSEYGIDLNFKVSPDKAKSLKKNGAYLFVYKLNSPYLVEKEDHIYPTRDMRLDVAILNKEIQAEVLEMWFFDSSTGEIIKKIKL